MEMTIETIREKGKKAGLSYLQALTLYLFEDILYRISQSEWKDDLWLKPEEFQVKEKRKTPVSNEIVYYTKRVTHQGLRQVMQEIIWTQENVELLPDWKILYFDRQVEIVMSFQVEEMTIPFKIVVRPVWQQEVQAETGAYEPIFIQEAPISYKEYPTELNLAECFYEIIERLELIGDMKVYEVAWQILKKEAVDGRHIYMCIEEFLEKRGVTSVEKRWQTVLGYANYKYMEKRWKKYRKNRKEETIEWKDLIDLLDKFYTPVWAAMQEERIFMGDWIPHLGRYIG